LFCHHSAVSFENFGRSPFLTPPGCLDGAVLIKARVKPQLPVAIYILKLPDHIVK
jgi:hypothetical protein